MVGNLSGTNFRNSYQNSLTQSTSEGGPDTQNATNGLGCTISQIKARIPPFLSVLTARLKQKNIYEQKLSKLPEFKIGDVVSIPIPKVDRANIAPRNIPARIEKIDKNNYTLLTESGVLEVPISRSQLSLWTGTAPEFPESLESVSLVKAFRFGSGFQTKHASFCKCTSDCQTKRCSCFKLGIECCSKCHSQKEKCGNKS